MLAHYLLDIHSNPVTSARIVDVSYPTDGQSVLNGEFVVRIPEGVVVQDPADLTDLLTQKYQGLISVYTTTTRIAFDDLLDPTGIDTGASSNLILGQRGNIGLFPGSVLQSLPATLTGAVAGQAFVAWELFEVLYDDPSDGRAIRTYSEVASSPSFATVSVSFNGGSTFIPSVSNGNVVNVLPADQGTSFIFRITNVHATKRLYLSSWSVVY